MRQVFHSRRAPDAREDDTALVQQTTPLYGLAHYWDLQASQHEDTNQLDLSPPMQMHTPDERYWQEYSCKIRDYVNGGRSSRSDESIEARPWSLGIPCLVHWRALKDGHDDLSGAVCGNDGGYYPGGDHESSVGVEDATIQKEGGVFDGCCCYGVENLD